MKKNLGINAKRIERELLKVKCVRYIDEQIERGIRAVDKLDAYCENKYRDNAMLPGAWKSASHLELRRVHPRQPTV